MGTRVTGKNTVQGSCDRHTFFDGFEDARQVYAVVETAVLALGSVSVRVGKSQIAFRRLRAFAWAWVPGRYLHGATAPLVLSIALRRRDASPRWKEVVEPAPGRFMHHLELRTSDALDPEVLRWLREAWEEAA